MSQNVPGDSKPIVITADEIVTWLDGSHRMLLFKGLVLIEHGVVHAQMQRAVAWVDIERTKKTGIMRVDVYAEGDVKLENSPESKTGPRALIDLNTRGELKLKSLGGKVVQTPRPQDPFFRHAVAERAALTNPKPPAPEPKPVIQRTSYQVPATDAPAAPNPQRIAPVPNPVVPGASTPPIVVPPASGPIRTPVPGAPPSNNSSPPTAYPPSSITPSQQSPPPEPENPPENPPPAQQPPANLPQTPNGTDGDQGPPQARVAPPRQIHVVPRTSADFHEQAVPLPNGEVAYVVTGGVILTVSNPTDRISILDMEADRLVIWTHGNVQKMLGNMRRPQGELAREVEFYLAGNVEIRSRSKSDEHILRADEVYYDVGRNVAVAYQADLEFKQPRMPDPIHMKADELLQYSPNLFKAARAEVFSSRLPSDPGIKIVVRDANLEQKQVPKRTGLFRRQSIDPKTGQPELETEKLFWGKNVFVKAEDVPVMYLPYLQGDPDDPLGPLESININYNKMYGTQIFTTWNVYDLLGMTPRPGTRWNFNGDWMSKRGPALGTNFDYVGTSLLGVPGKHEGYVKAYGMYDKGYDLLGGDRGAFQDHPPYRGRVFWHHNQDLPNDFFLQIQGSGLSDKNFMEEFYYNEFNTFVNQETFIYLKQQRDNWAWSILTEPRVRNWVDETQWLPRLDGYLLGQSFFDLVTYNAHASAAYARLMTTHVPPPPSGLTTFGSNTGRFDLWQELSLPFYLGPIKTVPFGIVDLTQYTQNLNFQSQGRFYGAGGLRSALPLSRIFPSAQSELLNLNGINHKVVLSGNYYAAYSDVGFTQLPQLDRLQDDATDQSIRDINPIQPFINPTYGTLLATSTLYDPQVYAIRRLQLFNLTDTLDSMQELQMDLRQRWQTKRGYPGLQHTIDWIMLDVSASYFPQPGQDNFNSPFAFVRYDTTWNVGDRTAIVSNGWWDPITNGARMFTVGAYLNRPDRTNFYLGYTQLDLIGSQLLTGAASYVFSPKYAMTVSSSYDIGLQQSLSNALIFTRMGSDLQISLGVTYNAVIKNFGVLFEILPNVAAQTGRRVAATSDVLAQ